MISTNDVKPGMALALPDGLFSIVHYEHVKPGKGKAFVRMKLKNIETGWEEITEDFGRDNQIKAQALALGPAK